MTDKKPPYNLEDYKTLIRGSMYWNSYVGDKRRQNPIWRADFTGADLTGIELPAAHLTGANLTEADLEGTNLKDANLVKANLVKANLKRASLTNANLRGASLEGANLTGAKLTGLDLKETYLKGANFQEADLKGVDLSRAYLEGHDLIAADLRGAKLTKVKLRAAKLISANLKEADLKGADLRGANLRATNLVRADLRGAKLTEANLTGANLKRADLRGAVYMSKQLEDTVGTPILEDEKTETDEDDLINQDDITQADDQTGKSGTNTPRNIEGQGFRLPDLPGLQTLTGKTPIRYRSSNGQDRSFDLISFAVAINPDRKNNFGDRFDVLTNSIHGDEQLGIEICYFEDVDSLFAGLAENIATQPDDISAIVEQILVTIEERNAVPYYGSLLNWLPEDVQETVKLLGLKITKKGKTTKLTVLQAGACIILLTAAPHIGEGLGKGIGKGFELLFEYATREVIETLKEEDAPKPAKQPEPDRNAPVPSQINV